MKTAFKQSQCVFDVALYKIKPLVLQLVGTSNYKIDWICVQCAIAVFNVY